MWEVLGRHSRVAGDALLKVLPTNPLPAAEPTPTTTIYDKSMTHTVVTGQSEKAHTLITMTISTLRYKLTKIHSHFVQLIRYILDARCFWGLTAMALAMQRSFYLCFACFDLVMREPRLAILFQSHVHQNFIPRIRAKGLRRRIRWRSSSYVFLFTEQFTY